MVVVSGPSGAGKDTVLDVLKARIGGADFIVTITTRPKREYEKDGQNYHFVSPEYFQEMRSCGQLLEHACVYGNWYGVPKEEVSASIRNGRDAVIKVDIQGAETIKSLIPDACFIFIAPPDIADLDSRLKKRNTESNRELEERLKTAGNEYDKLPMFDYLVINASGRVDQAVEDVVSIIRAEKLKISSRAYKNL